MELFKLFINRLVFLFSLVFATILFALLTVVGRYGLADLRQPISSILFIFSAIGLAVCICYLKGKKLF